MTLTPDEPILSAEKTARLLHIHANTLRRWTTEGKIQRWPPFNRGEWFYRLKDVEKLYQKYFSAKENGDFADNKQAENVDRREMIGAPGSVENAPPQYETENEKPAEAESRVIWMVDIDRPQYLTFVSPSISKLVGYSHDEVMAMPMKDAFTSASLGRIGRAAVEQLVNLKPKPGDTNQSVTLYLELVHKNGSMVPVEVTYTCIPAPGGKPAAIMAIARNTSADTKTTPLGQEQTNKPHFSRIP